MKRNIESFMRYHQAKEALAEYTQIGAAAIHLLKLNVSVSNGDRLLGQFVDSCDVQHWGAGKRFPDPVGKTTEIGNMFANQVLVQQVSAFDLFSRSVLSDFARFSSWARQHCSLLVHQHALTGLSPQGRWVVSPCCNELEGKLGDLIDRLDDLKRILQWVPTAKLESLVPLFHMARMLRNRIVHADGLVGSDLEELSESSDIQKAHKSFRTNYAKAELPPLPVLKRGEYVTLQSVIPIYFGAILYEFAREINIFVCSKLTDKEFVEMGFFYGCLVETHPARTIKHRDAGARIKHFLASRYLFKDASHIKDPAAFLKNKVSSGTGKKTVESTYWRIALERHEKLAQLENSPTKMNSEIT